MFIQGHPIVITSSTVVLKSAAKVAISSLCSRSNPYVTEFAQKLDRNHSKPRNLSQSHQILKARLPYTSFDTPTLKHLIKLRGASNARASFIREQS